MGEHEKLLRLKNAIIEGLSDEVTDLVKQALEAQVKPKRILNEAIISGAEVVGKKYEKGEYFLADMLLAADAINDSMDLIKPKLDDGTHQPHGKLLIGTPEGDLHDIGKSLIIALLQGQGFDVIDLGVDVPPKKFLEVAKKENPDIIGLSGLLTVTISKMTETVSLLKREGIKAKIILGGGILSEESCKNIGADAWTKDGWEASLRRMWATFTGASKIDRVPFYPLACEEMICRISGKTFQELISNPKTYANAVISTYEFLKADILSVPTAYAGPAEALAFAEANNKKDLIKWSDYKVFMVKQGAICKTEEDIERLEIPDHNKISLWNKCISAINYVREKTTIMQGSALGIWCVVQELRGTQAYRDMRRNPDLLLELCEKVYESQMDLYNLFMEKVGHNPTIFFTGYAFNKHMMSFEDAMKYEGQFIKRIQKKTNAQIILHNCGTSPYFDEMCKELNLLAINGSHPLDIKYWVEFKKNHPEVTILGANIDVSRELLNGTPLDVENKVKENIMHLAAGGRYAVGPICCLPWGVSLKNIMTIPRAIKKWGTYPIKFN